MTKKAKAILSGGQDRPLKGVILTQLSVEAIVEATRPTTFDASYLHYSQSEVDVGMNGTSKHILMTNFERASDKRRSCCAQLPFRGGLRAVTAGHHLNLQTGKVPQSVDVFFS